MNRLKDCCLSAFVETHQGKYVCPGGRPQINLGIFDTFEVLDAKF
jgi:hypothetical protein